MSSTSLNLLRLGGRSRSSTSGRLGSTRASSRGTSRLFMVRFPFLTPGTLGKFPLQLLLSSRRRCRVLMASGVDAIIIDEAVPSAAKHDISKTTMGLRTHLDLTKPAQGVHKPASEVHTTAPKPTALPSRPLIIRSAEDILLLRKVPSIDVKDLRNALTGAELKVSRTIPR